VRGYCVLDAERGNIGVCLLLIGLALSACASRPSAPGQTGTWTAERTNEAARTVTMVCRASLRSGPRCDPGAFSITVDAQSACRDMGFENAFTRPLTSSQTALFERSVRYSITFECVGPEGC